MLPWFCTGLAVDMRQIVVGVVVAVVVVVAAAVVVVVVLGRPLPTCSATDS